MDVRCDSREKGVTSHPESFDFCSHQCPISSVNVNAGIMHSATSVYTGGIHFAYTLWVVGVWDFALARLVRESGKHTVSGPTRSLLLWEPRVVFLRADTLIPDVLWRCLSDMWWTVRKSGAYLDQELYYRRIRFLSIAGLRLVYLRRVIII